MQYSNKEIPLIDKVIYSLEKEAIPRWSKFLQGYYDYSSISSDSFDEAIHINKNGIPSLTDELQKQNIVLQTTISPTIFYLGFNMFDEILGGYSQEAIFLRHAISIAVDFEEFISIFSNGRGEVATGPVPPSILPYTKDTKNMYVFNHKVDKPTRKSLKVAKKLLTKAGYANGIDPKTGRPLIINYDVAMSGGPDDKERFNWMRKQFKKLGLSLNIRATHYNRFQDKILDGNVQMFMLGWHADYPDPENFLFLF